MRHTVALPMLSGRQLDLGGERTLVSLAAGRSHTHSHKTVGDLIG